MKRWIVRLAVLAVLLSRAPATASVMVDYSKSGPTMQSTLQVGFRNQTTLQFDDVAASGFASQPPPLVYGSTVDVSLGPLSHPGPPSGTGTAEGQSTLQLVYGSGPGAADELTLDGSGTLSALDAKNGSDRLNALARVLALVEFSVDANYGQYPVQPNALVGTMSVHAPGALGSYETQRRIAVRQYTGQNIDWIVTLAANDDDAVVNLLADHTYKIEFFYEAEVPYGIDPPFSIGGMGVTLHSVIPEPSSVIIWSLFGVGTIAAASWRRRRPS